MADLKAVSLTDFIVQLDRKDGLRLKQEEVSAAVKLLEEQWFTNASELASIDSEALSYLELPPKLGIAIIKSFHQGDPWFDPDANVDEENKAKSDSDDEKDRPINGEKPKNEGYDTSSHNLHSVIETVMKQCSDNPFVMEGLSNLLKRGITDSGGGTIKQNMLRGYLRQVAQSSTQNPGQEVKSFQDEEKEVKFDASEYKGVNPCNICGGRKDTPLQLDCQHWFCMSCIHEHIVKLVGQRNVIGMKCPANSCQVEIAVPNIQKLLSPDEFNSYLEATLMVFIENDNLTFKCPNDACKSIISVQPSRPQEIPNPIPEVGDDNQPISVEAWLHFKEFRVRCRDCGTVFCASCKRIPYHKGYTCESFLEFEKSRHCRFCGANLTDKNTASNPPSLTLRDVCMQQDCLDKREICCTRTKECGCCCNGVRGEDIKDCVPCLKHELNQADEFCTICYVEALKDAPCIQLGNGCNHIFHYVCLKSKIEASWPGARISFDFRCCPLCHKRVEHPSLATILQPINVLEKTIQEKSLERLKYEGRDKDSAIVSPNGRFYNDPVGFAMHEFLFYMCHKCKKPYFAGGYQCQEANAPFNPEELVCPACQPSSVGDCPVHGKDWLAYKCRFCCTYANWYCWGQTHFCDQCHKSGVWQKLCEYRTGKNKKKFAEFTQCPGLKKQIQVIMDDRSIPDTEKEKRIEKLTADPLQCPLRVPHPPNGIEFGLGCSMCEDKKDERVNKEAAEKAKKEEAEKRQILNHVKMQLSQNPNGMSFEYSQDFDEKGVFHFLGTAGGAQKWTNPCDAGFIRVSSSGIMSDSQPLSTVLGRELVRVVSKPTRNSWIMIDLIDLSLEPTHYTLRHYSSWDTECLRYWVLEGSDDGVNWECLKVHQNDKTLNKKGAAATWPIDAHGQRYRMFRILQTGMNSNNHYYLALSGIEMYGRLYDGIVQDNENKFNVENDGVIGKFEHKFDFDTNGILYFLGTDMGKKSWVNPAQIGQVIVTSSQLATKPSSRPAEAIVGRELCRCVTAAKPDMWFAIDLKEKKAQITHYTLKHYDSWENECMRNWRLEGSSDGVVWTTLKNHVDDGGLNGKGSTHTWQLDSPEAKEFYSMFRLYQTGKNSNNHFYLACSGMELYGVLAQTPPISIGAGGLELKYQYDFDNNGFFYWLGTRGKQQAWRNPALLGLVTVTASALSTNPPSQPASYIVGRELTRCVSAAAPNMWFMVDLKDKKIRITNYTIRHYNSWDTEALRNWVFEGSNDGHTWVILREHVNDDKLDKKGATYTWPVNASSRYQMLRIRQTGLNSNNHHYLACSGFEVYGHVTNANQPEEPMLSPRDPGVAPIPVPIRDNMEFKYVSDFDDNGIIYWLGTLGKTRPFKNPALPDVGLVLATSSDLASQSLPAWAACGRDVVRCATEPKKNSWFCFDLRNVFVIPTAYTLRHYDSWDTEALRQWKLEGSNDGKKWKSLMSHKKDEALNKIGATHTWQIKGISKSYSMFRITQTGKNSNKHYYLALSGFELYGTVFTYRKK